MYALAAGFPEPAARWRDLSRPQAVLPDRRWAQFRKSNSGDEAMSLRSRNRILGTWFSVVVTAAVILSITLLSGFHSTAMADDPDDVVVMFNSIPNPTPGNIASEGPEAYAYSQIGDGLMLAGAAGRTLDKVTVVMSSWACVSGNWYGPANCATPAGSTYTLPITVNIYSVVSTGETLEGDSPAPAPGTLLATLTQDFTLPYRPSSDTVNCVGGPWYDSTTQTCYNGIAAPITFDLSSLKVKLPKKIIVGFQFNSTHYGPSPIGQSAPCFSAVVNGTTPGCFYDSLNVSTDDNNGYFRAIGSVLDVDGIFFNYTNAGNSCNGAATTGVFGLDAAPGCWTGYHPEIQVTARKNDGEKVYKHGHQP
jgi:hypothetical protein